MKFKGGQTTNPSSSSNLLNFGAKTIMASRIRSFFFATSRRRPQSGAAIVEILLVVPTIFILTFLTLEITNIMRIYEKTSWVAEYAVRQASEGIQGGYRLSSQVVEGNVDDRLRKLVGDRYINDDNDIDDHNGFFCILYYEDGKRDLDDLSCNGRFDDQEDFGPGHFVHVEVITHYEPMFVPGLFKQILGNEKGELTIRSGFDRIISASAPD